MWGLSDIVFVLPVWGKKGTKKICAHTSVRRMFAQDCGPVKEKEHLSPTLIGLDKLTDFPPALAEYFPIWSHRRQLLTERKFLQLPCQKIKTQASFINLFWHWHPHRPLYTAPTQEQDEVPLQHNVSATLSLNPWPPSGSRFIPKSAASISPQRPCQWDWLAIILPKIIWQSVSLTLHKLLFTNRSFVRRPAMHRGTILAENSWLLLLKRCWWARL